MNRFGQFDVKVNTQVFVGDKIKMSKVLGKELIVHAFRLEPSKHFQDKGTGQCLYLQIFIDNEKRIIFTSAVGMIEAIQQIPRDGFPFTTVIKVEDERYYFS